jgi:SIR2-like domain
MGQVFLLGAGFSKCAGHPLNNDLPGLITEEVFKKAQANTHLELTEGLSPLEAIKDKDYHTTLPGLYLKQVAMNTNRKDFDAFIERCTSIPDDLSEEWRSVLKDWFTTYGTIRSSVEEAIKAILERQPTRTDYIDRLVSYCQRTGSPIYSTNFDGLIEQSCVRLGLEPDVAATTSRETGMPKANFTLHKINGSIDWDHFAQVKDLALNQYPVRHERASGCMGSQKIALTAQDKLSTMATALPSLFQMHEDFRRYKKLTAIGTSFQDRHINSVAYSCLLLPDYEFNVVLPNEELPINILFLAESLTRNSLPCGKITHARMTASEFCSSKLPLLG